jgi:hypothetical protein
MATGDRPLSFSLMRTKEIRPTLDPETCAVCERRLLQGEMQTRFVSPDGSRHIVCELCIPRADRLRWVREREGEQPLGPLPPAPRRPGMMRRVIDWFGGADQGDRLDDDEAARVAGATTGDATDRMAARQRRRSRLPKIETPQPEADRKARVEVPAQPVRQRNVTAVPTDEEAKLQRGLELFNHSQFPRTIAGLTRSLGLPQVAILHAGGNSVEIFVAWGISWYSYRVDLGDATEPVELSGRGNDSAELGDVVGEWNVIADEGGVLVLNSSTSDGVPIEATVDSPAAESSDTEPATEPSTEPATEPQNGDLNDSEQSAQPRRPEAGGA